MNEVPRAHLSEFDKAIAYLREHGTPIEQIAYFQFLDGQPLARLKDGSVIVLEGVRPDGLVDEMLPGGYARSRGDVVLLPEWDERPLPEDPIDLVKSVGVVPAVPMARSLEELQAIEASDTAILNAADAADHELARAIHSGERDGFMRRDKAIDPESFLGILGYKTYGEYYDAEQRGFTEPLSPDEASNLHASVGNVLDPAYAAMMNTYRSQVDSEFRKEDALYTRQRELAQRYADRVAQWQAQALRPTRWQRFKLWWLSLWAIPSRDDGA